jgi:hypothetical protein
MHDQAFIHRISLLRGLLRYRDEHQRLLAWIRENMPSDVSALKFTEEEIKLLEGFLSRASSAQTQGALERIIADIRLHRGFYGINAYVELSKTSGTDSEPWAKDKA